MAETQQQVVPAPYHDPEKRKDGFSQARKQIFLKTLRKCQGKVVTACRLSDTHFMSYYGHSSPDSPQYDPGFASHVKAIKREYALEVEEVLLDMAKVAAKIATCTYGRLLDATLYVT